MSVIEKSVLPTEDNAIYAFWILEVVFVSVSRLASRLMLARAHSPPRPRLPASCTIGSCGRRTEVACGAWRGVEAMR